MQTPRDKQPTFFDLSVQQRGGANPVLDIIAREVDFTAAEALSPPPTATADGPPPALACSCAS
ncbi:MAG: hypothetical protein IPK15_04300 [Verrucomicrobia bacterium]|nr:hypothetical protein [Verrucomicrobiota bacterium]